MMPGLGWRLVEHGLVWPTRRTLRRGREVFRRSYPPPDPVELPHFVSLPQVEAEQILLGACKEAGVEIEYEAAVAGVKSGPDGVTLEGEDGRTWTARYVIAADGSRSVVRRSIGIDMEGSRSKHHYVIADIAEDPEDPLPLERIFHYEHPAVEGRNVLLVPFAGGWRADLQLRRGDVPTEFGSEEGARRWIGAVLGEKYRDRVTWVSTYQFLQVVARSFVDEQRRVLLVGESAHLFAPFGARGLNSGVADAAAAGSAVATALVAGSPDVARAAIDRFAEQRRAAALWNRHAAGRALRHLRGRGLVERVKRLIATLMAPLAPRAGAWLDEAPYGPRSGPPVAPGEKY
jgi:3-(3-hydroxy-phenyl)propionate hydroxylase